jgi:predicted restriction endonuclease
VKLTNGLVSNGLAQEKIQAKYLRNVAQVVKPFHTVHDGDITMLRRGSNIALCTGGVAVVRQPDSASARSAA